MSDDSIDLEILRAGGWLRHAEWHESLGSTNDRGKQLAQDAAAALPALIGAQRQTAGRGRGANRWWTGQGSLAFSLVFEPAAAEVPARQVPLLSLAAAVAMVDALRPLLPDERVGLHWPNDVFVDERKIAGILVEAPPGSRVVVGIGVNVNNPLDGAPEEVRARAATLCELCGARLSRTELLREFLANYAARVRELARDAPAVCQAADERCLQHDAYLVVDRAGERIAGRCDGIEEDGALRLLTPSGLQRIYAGVLVRP